MKKLDVVKPSEADVMMKRRRRITIEAPFDERTVRWDEDDPLPPVWVKLVWGAIAIAVVFGVSWLVSILSRPAEAQPVNHDAHHAQYQNWQSQSGFNCCNNQDCGELSDKDVREDGPVQEVLIEGQWCPVLPSHLLRVGKSPDGSRFHACITAGYTGLSTCERFKCFTDKTRF